MLMCRPDSKVGCIACQPTGMREIDGIDSLIPAFFRFSSSRESKADAAVLVALPCLA